MKTFYAMAVPALFTFEHDHFGKPVFTPEGFS
jgi:hypothetical protein